MEKIPSQIEKNELSFFEIPENLKDRAGGAVEIGDFINTVDETEKKAEEIPIKVYRSKEWNSCFEKDKNYQHPVTYYADIEAICKEYLPDSLLMVFEKKWEELELKYPLLGMSFKDSNDLFYKVLRKTASQKEIELNNLRKKQVNEALEEFDKFKKATILESSKIEKRIIALKNPLIIRGYKYEGEGTFNRSEYGVKDIRYISKEEVDSLKEKGYDGIIYEQYNWIILF